MSGNSSEQARAYLQQMRQDGRTGEEIRQVLLEAGWAEQQVERLLAPEVPQPPRAKLPPPAPGARADDGASESYHIKDNVIQGIVVAAGTLIGAGIGALLGGMIGALVGAVIGLIVSYSFVSGLVLMIVGASRAIKRRARKQ